MAKKKQDTKGLAGVINKVPREIDIRGIPHMLAWITPEEGKTLKKLGGSGELGPMGIPSYNPNEDRANEEAAADDDMGDSDTMSGPSNSSSSSSNDKGNNSYDADTGIDAETDDPDTAGAGSRVTGYSGPDDPGGERMGTPGASLGDYYGGSGIDGDNRNMTKEEFGLSVLRNNQLLGGSTGARNTTWFTDIGSAGQAKARGAVQGLIDAEIERRKGNASSGYGLKGPLSGLGSVLGAVGNFTLSQIQKGLEDPNSIPAFDENKQIQGVYTPGLFGGMVYTGNPIEGFEETGWSPDDNKGNDNTKSSVIKAVEEAAVKPIVTSTDAYYGRGVGTGTLDMTDPSNIAKYLLQVGGQGVGGQTPSAIGATYDPIKKVYTLPDGTQIDAVTGRKKKLSGLEIFRAT